MRVAALYDIHGNLPALEAVLREIHEINIDRIVIGGDVLLGPMSVECVVRLSEEKIPVYFIQGNCEIAVLSYLRGNKDQNLPADVIRDIEWLSNQLLPIYVELIAMWPQTVSLNIHGLGNVFFCHATPRSATESLTSETPEESIFEAFESVKEKIVVCGHTHKQFDRMIRGIRILNAGSVGMPFEKTGAFWLLLGPDIQFCCTQYDLAEAANQILKTTYPQSKKFTDNLILGLF